MTERSDVKKLARQPAVFELNGEEITIEPLVIKDARIFRNELKKVVNQAMDLVEEENWPSLLDLVNDLLSENLIDLVQLASPELREKGTEWLENNITEAQLQDLFIEAVQINYPWLKKMVQLGELGRVYNQTQKMKKEKTEQ